MNSRVNELDLTFEIVFFHDVLREDGPRAQPGDGWSKFAYTIALLRAKGSGRLGQPSTPSQSRRCPAARHDTA